VTRPRLFVSCPQVQPWSLVTHLPRWDNALVHVVLHEAIPRAERQRCGQREGRGIRPVSPAGGVRPGSENRMLRVDRFRSGMLGLVTSTATFFWSSARPRVFKNAFHRRGRDLTNSWLLCNRQRATAQECKKCCVWERWVLEMTVIFLTD